jgi:hypothetical protein
MTYTVRLPPPHRHRLFIHALRLSWVVCVLWFELGIFDCALSNCHWPTPQSTDDSVRNNPHLSPICPDPRSQPEPSRTSNILIVADPQIINSRSYPNRNFILARLTQFIVDLNLRKSWRLVAMKMRPHVVVFLGDMMDGGRGEMGDDE